MNEPLFKMGQRVYNRAKPYQGRVIDIRECLGS
jgi:heat shock protein HspQ